MEDRLEFRIANVDKRGGHVWFNLFVGAPGKAGARCGHICMRPDEFDAFRRLIVYQNRAAVYREIADEIRELQFVDSVEELVQGLHDKVTPLLEGLDESRRD